MGVAGEKGGKTANQIPKEESMQKITRRLVLGTSLALGLSFSAMGSALAEDYKWPAYFSVITPIVGSANHSLAVAWTTEFTAQTGVRVAIKPAPNGYARPEWLNTGEGEISLMQANEYFDQMDAVEGFATRDGGPSDTRVAVMNLITPWGYMVKADGPLKKFTDVNKDTTIAHTASSSFLSGGIQALLAYNDLTLDDVNKVETSNYGANTAVVTEGRAEVAFTSPLSGTSYEAEAAPGGITWLPLPKKEEDPEAFARYRELSVGYVPFEATSGTKSVIGIYMDHAFQANHVRADADPEFVYNLLKWLDEHYEDFKDDYQHAHMMSVESLKTFVDAGALQPLHEGAIKYLKEKGIWTDAHQARQDALVKLATDRVALWQDTIAAADEKGIEVSPESEEFRALWEQMKADAGVTKPYANMVGDL
jgi:TRAP transporter TAXI family solute receptor